MKKQATLYFLYCVNAQCQFSVHQLMVELRIPLTSENLDSVHKCSCCYQQLVSEIDVETQHTIAETKSQMLYIPDYLNN